jgi:hypothetical protein
MLTEIFGHASIHGPASESRSLLAENRAMGWTFVDPSCPPHIAKKIIEFRSKQLGVYAEPALTLTLDDIEDARMRAALAL